MLKTTSGNKIKEIFIGLGYFSMDEVFVEQNTSKIQSSKITMTSSFLLLTSFLKLIQKHTD